MNRPDKTEDFKPEGIIPAMITPLDAAGEFYGLTPEEKRLIFQVTMDQTRSRVPVYAGTNGITMRESVELTHIAEECKVDAVSVLTPMFISPSQEQLLEHYRSIAANTSLPVIMYNNPPKTKVSLSPATVAELADLPNIVCIKDSCGDLTITAEYIRLTRGKKFSVLMGRDTLILGALCYGATGSIASCANVALRSSSSRPCVSRSSSGPSPQSSRSRSKCSASRRDPACTRGPLDRG